MARPSATDRVGRILVIVPWIAERGRTPIAEVCQRFGMSEAELLADLEVVPFVGRYPYTPDNLIEVVLDEGHVEIDYGNFFERPLRLSREEALSLLTAGQALLTSATDDTSGPLARGLAKVADVLGVELGDDLQVVLTGALPDIQEMIESAIRTCAVLRIGYFSHGRNEHSVRDVEPRRLFHAEGAWYLSAYCRASEARRVFRVDRITEVDPTGEHFERSDDADAPVTFAPSRDDPRVTLDLDTAGAWVAQQYPIEDRVELPDGRLRVTLAVAATPWLARLLLQLGPHVRVVEAPDDLRRCGAEAARMVLARYGSA